MQCVLVTPEDGVLTFLVGVRDRIMHPPQMSMPRSPEPVNMLCDMAERALQMWLM